MMMPLLGLEDGMYDDFAASVSGMMVSVYGVAIVKPLTCIPPLRAMPT